ncbi:MAG: ferrochelatase [Candidatus Obscuribacterales bacterium]|nr:ferrochelatase [Steroidobacteraceae bacterium]
MNSTNAVKTGLLLVNLGTPTAPTPDAVRRFLAEFLSDRRVVELSPLLWWPILHGVILRLRPKKSAHAYAQIWTPSGSPLLVQSTALSDALRLQLETTFGNQVTVALGMTYGQPSLAGALRTLRDQQVNQLIVLPLYPQYSGTTTASVFDRVARELKTWRNIPSLHFIGDYHDDANYIAALAHSVREHWLTQPRDHLFLSFHGVPQRCIDKGDPYLQQCKRTGELIAARLNLKPDEWSMAFQSRFGRVQWIKPYTEEVLREYAKRGPKNLTVLCPGFAVDCLETLEEIALRNRADFIAAGGERFNYVPCLNARPAHVEAMSHLVQRYLKIFSTPPNQSPTHL